MFLNIVIIVFSLFTRKGWSSSFYMKSEVNSLNRPFLLREIKCNSASDGAFTIFMNILLPPMFFTSLPAVGSKLDRLHICLLLDI